jgi:iron complex transport system ATP-binding protein
MVDPLLIAEGLSVERGRRRVLSDIDLSAAEGQIFAILGPNGAGKSTLLRALAGLLPYRGAIRVAGQDLCRVSRRERAKRLAYVPQQSALHSALPVRTVVAQGRYAHAGSLRGPSSEDRARIEQVLHTTDVARFASRAFTSLSVGEQRRVLIARALCTGSRVVCLDEPTAAFDVAQSLRLYRLLRELADQGHAVIVVVHQLDDALRHADRALLLSAGRCVRSGATREVVTEDTVREVYGVQMQPRAGLRFELPGADP